MLFKVIIINHNNDKAEDRICKSTNDKMVNQQNLYILNFFSKCSLHLSFFSPLHLLIELKPGSLPKIASPVFSHTGEITGPKEGKCPHHCFPVISSSSSSPKDSTFTFHVNRSYYPVPQLGIYRPSRLPLIPQRL